jgi:hypothetical protein
MNTETYLQEKMASVIKDADAFGLTFLGDGATTGRMPLINVLVLNGNSYPVVAAIRDCTGHRADGGKKDTLYITNLFNVIVVEYDPDKSCTDIFYFDSASNVQKAGVSWRFITPGRTPSMAGNIWWLCGSLDWLKYQQ